MLVNVGAAIVGNIVPYWYNEKLNDFDKIIDSWKLGPEKNLKVVEKGQEIAFFQMGSTVILILPPGPTSAIPAINSCVSSSMLPPTSNCANA